MLIISVYKKYTASKTRTQFRENILIIQETEVSIVLDDFALKDPFTQKNERPITTQFIIRH